MYLAWKFFLSSIVLIIVISHFVIFPPSFVLNFFSPSSPYLFLMFFNFFPHLCYSTSLHLHTSSPR